MHIPRIAITPGEPAGIGPDICLQICAQDWSCELIFIADPDLLQRRASQLGLDINIQIVDLSQPPSGHRAGILKVLPVKLSNQEHSGKLDARNASYVIETLRTAAQLCMDKTCVAVVTGPVQKSIINQASIAFSGHTEFFAEVCGGFPVMLLATTKLKVALATTHLPLKDVSQAITRPLLQNVITILHHDLQKKFAIQSPRIAVCGLNPHAGENGHIGQEELETIIPALNALREKGFKLTGPLPADTAFNPPILKNHDVILAMYHDQGLPTLKYAGFGEAINITLGLPIIRTSVDHGTALGLAGTGQASASSLKSALIMAIQLASKYNSEQTT
ncbi:MAG TPA: 4-hydroxythreonine-4-phosphate dehydrogenase PdxA [Cycloclasticus sp.]|nr:4-hydroxythreonine-4-phosphate dehydrogenase PdxA [Cycloclasticus sp.]HIL92749.1 4-hydroxythreonine-4-phosphate dehydrogenase PdxA [Cycloclasticus sp.]